jgi:hypothetical protein
MIPLFRIDEVCHICRKACLNTFGEYTVHCKKLTAISIDMALLGISFFIYSGGREY